MGQFFIRKNTKPGEGVEGGLAKHQTFYLIFLLKPFLSFEDGGCFDDHIKEKIGSDDVLKQHISWQRT